MLFFSFLFFLLLNLLEEAQAIDRVMEKFAEVYYRTYKASEFGNAGIFSFFQP